MPEKIPNIVTSVPGPKSQRFFKEEQEFIAPGLQTIALLSGLVIDHGEGALVTDVDGN
ncbi:MAG: 4-aminobutyrate--2-oxoglutarate transaminase, partial [Candidatus Tectomicrobia bacterium]|nr:4-aminobutyrate--2-oxoglutarate transaminase [Candidatus Tectomicrobia bacterium]